MHHRRTVCLCIVMVLFAQQAFGDVVATRTGEKFVGTLANREEVRSSPHTAAIIGMLLSDSGELVRFRVEDIEYIVLEDGDRQEVIDLLSSPKRDASPGSVRYPEVRTHDYSGVLIALGFIAGAVGVAFKFGGPKCTIDESSIDCDEKSYDGVNYALMAGGGSLMILGIVQSQIGSKDTRKQSGPLSNGPSLLLSRERNGVRIGLRYRLAF